MKTKTLSIIIISILISLNSFSQTDSQASTKYPEYKFAIGAGAGISTGFGASFRYTPNRFGFQATFTPMYDDNDYRTETRISAGISFLYRLIESKNTSFYLYQGNHYFYDKSVSNNYGYVNEDKDFITGVGIGIEFVILKRVSFNIMGGYATNNFESLQLTGELGLYYKF